MSEAGNSNEKKFTKLILEPRKRFVRIHRTPNAGRDYFTVSFYDEYGKRQRRAYREISTAEAEAAKIRQRIDNGNVPGMLLSGRERIIYERAVEAAQSAGVELDVLTMDAAKARAVLGTVSLADAAQFYLEHRSELIQKTVSEVVAELVVDRLKMTDHLYTLET